MANKKLIAISAVLLIGMILAACNLPASTEPPPIDQSSAQTAAAETIVAQLTEVAETLVPTEPGGSPPDATQTAVISAATETTEPTSPPPATATEAAASPTMTATSPPPPTPTLDADDPKAGLGEPDFFNVKDSNLVMTALNPDKYNGWMLTWPVISDYYLEITAKTQQCSGKDTYGNMVRAVKTDKGYIGYLYNISCDGHYSLRRWNGEQYVSLVDWTPSDQINSGANQTNRIGLMVNGSQFTFYANGKQIGQIQDDTHMEGRFGVVIGSANTPDLTVRLDEIAVWNLP